MDLPVWWAASLQMRTFGLFVYLLVSIISYWGFCGYKEKEKAS